MQSSQNQQHKTDAPYMKGHQQDSTGRTYRGGKKLRYGWRTWSLIYKGYNTPQVYNTTGRTKGGKSNIMGRKNMPIKGGQKKAAGVNRKPE